eukprot:scaffold40368_cov59-Phaeocystis_antarctica.AAC.2
MQLRAIALRQARGIILVKLLAPGTPSPPPTYPSLTIRVPFASRLTLSPAARHGWRDGSRDTAWSAADGPASRAW